MVVNIDIFTWAAIAAFPGTCCTFDLVQGDMASKELIDAQFDRAVQIVQGLPKTGPIQTDYEEKLTMYRYVCKSNSIPPHSTDTKPL